MKTGFAVDGKIIPCPLRTANTIREIKITKTEQLANERYLLKKITYDYTKADGTKKTQDREIYDRGNAATILLYNKEKRTVILTKQFRLSTFLNGNDSGMLLEACAGLLDYDSPEATAIREAEEETGYRVPEVKKIFDAYSSPGGLAELVSYFIAEYSQEMKVSLGGGVPEEEENIEVIEMDFDKAFQMLLNGELKDAKTVSLVQYLRLQGIL